MEQKKIADKIMENYIVRKHWLFWLLPVTVSILFWWTIIIPAYFLIWGILRWKLDKIEIKDGCLISRIGVVFIDKKAIPLSQISLISEKSNLLAQIFGCGTILVQSSAQNSTITYHDIAKPSDFILAYNMNKN